MIQINITSCPEHKGHYLVMETLNQNIKAMTIAILEGVNGKLNIFSEKGSKNTLKYCRLGFAVT